MTDITIHAMYRYDGANKGVYMTFNIQNSVYLPLYLIYKLFIDISMYGEVTCRNHQAYN